MDGAWLASELNTKLKGTFVVSEGGDIWYVSPEGTGIQVDAVDPTIVLAADESGDTITATVTYPSTATEVQYSIDGDAWQEPASSNLSLSIMALKVSAAETEKSFSVTLGYDNELNVRVSYPGNQVAESSTKLISDTAASLTEGSMVDLIYPTNAVTKQYRLNGGPWNNYPGAFVLTSDSVITMRCFDAADKIISYGEFTVTGTAYVHPVASFSLNPSVVYDNTALIWNTEACVAYQGATITAYEWQLDGSVVNNAPSTLTAGLHIVKLRVKDSNGAWSEWISKNVAVTTYQNPIAVITVNPGTIYITTNVTYSYSSTLNPGATVAAAEWKLDNGSAISTMPSTLSLGIHKVQLRIKDSNGIWSSWASKTVEVYLPGNAAFTLNSSGSNVTVSGNVGNGTSTMTTTGAGWAYYCYGTSFNWSNQMTIAAKVTDFKVTSGDANRLFYQMYITKSNTQTMMVRIFDKGTNYLVNCWYGNWEVLIPKSEGVYIAYSMANNKIYVNGKLYDGVFMEQPGTPATNYAIISLCSDSSAGTATATVTQFGVTNSNIDVSTLYTY